MTASGHDAIGGGRVAAATALSALPALVLDLETTGLDVTRDRIVQVGAVAMTGGVILESPRIDQRINPGVPIPFAASRIHGLEDADVANAPPIAELFDLLREALFARVVIGHNIAFDLAVLRYEAARAGVRWHEPPSLDVGLLVAALEPTLADVGLDSICRRLGIATDRRHDALGDSLAAAEIFARLVARLREADVRTFGEAQALAAQCDALVRRQAEAGWHGSPSTAPSAAVAAPLARIDSHIYATRIENVMRSPPVVAPPQTTLRSAARVMTERRVGALLVAAGGTFPEGIVTERDLLRALSDRAIDPDTVPISEAMTSPVESMAAGEMLYRALGRMDGLGIRHLCVVDDAGRALGMVSQRDLLRHRARSAAALGDRVARATTGPMLAAVHCELPRVAAELSAEGLGGVEVGRVVSNEVRAMTGRAAELAAEQTAASGHGPPPARWCVLVLGSAGRGESLLAADQDNALLHDGQASDDAWFEAMGAKMTALLDEGGIPFCNGGVMASNSEWRGDAARWRARVGSWIARVEPTDLLNVDIFFDLHAVAGDRGLGRDLQAVATEAASHDPTFSVLLARSVSRMPLPLDLFGRIRTRDGRVDLKAGGLLPLVSLVRALALRIGSTARSTPERIADARAAGRIPPGDAGALAEIHAELMTCILRQQLADVDGGIRPSSRVALQQLVRDDRRRLRRMLRQLGALLDGLHTAMAG